jgi:hypothetical protein
VARYGGPDQHATEEAKDIGIDAQGNVYVTGMAGGDREPNYATVKYDPNGNELWVSTYDGPGHWEFFCCSDYWDEPYDLALDEQGNVYVTGKSRGDKSNDDWATVKYNSNGVQVRVARYDSQNHDNDWAYDVVAAGSGDVFVASTSNPTDPLDFTSVYTVVKYAPGSSSSPEP